MSGNATDAHQTFLGRMGEALVEYMFLRARWDVMRFGKEVLVEDDSEAIVSRKGLKPDFRIEKNGSMYYLEVTTSVDGDLPEEKWDRIWAQLDAWPNTHVIMVHLSGNWRQYGDVESPLWIFDATPDDNGVCHWRDILPQEPPFNLTATAVKAACKRCERFLISSHRAFYEW